MPGSTAMLVDSLAARYHWPMHYIRWELPYSQVRQLQHCMAAENPYIWTVDPQPRERRPLDTSQLQHLLDEDAQVDLS